MPVPLRNSRAKRGLTPLFFGRDACWRRFHARLPPSCAQLPGLGINPDSISFKNTTMDSDKSICVREDVGEARNIVIVDVASRMVRHKKPMAAESAIMNPVSGFPGCGVPPPWRHGPVQPPYGCNRFAVPPDSRRRAAGPFSARAPAPASHCPLCVSWQDGATIAVRAGAQMQVFNLDLGKKLKSHKLDDGKSVQYWCWISANTIAIVTEAEVFHWSVDGTCPRCRLSPGGLAVNPPAFPLVLPLQVTRPLSRCSIAMPHWKARRSSVTPRLRTAAG